VQPEFARPERAKRVEWILVWAGLTTAAQLAPAYFYSRFRPAYPSSEVVVVFGLCAVGASQWLALRLGGVRWGREWAGATISGAVITSAIFDAAQHALRSQMAPSLLAILYPAIGATLTTTFQWLVVRRHVEDAGAWALAGAARFAVNRATYWIVFGSLQPAAAAQPIVPRVVVFATTALVEAAFMFWMLRRPLPEERLDRSDWSRLWVEWTAGAGLAVPLVMGLGGTIERLLSGRPPLAAMVGRPMFAAALGSVIGVIQWALLRERVSMSARWIAVSTGALAVPALGIFVPGIAVLVFYGWLMAAQIPLCTAAAGAWFGFWQWLVLRRELRHAIWWIPATSLGWLAFSLQRWPFTLSHATIGVIAGAVSGTMLVWLLRRSDARAPSSSASRERARTTPGSDARAPDDRASGPAPAPAPTVPAPGKAPE
jgi:hypothetical protein